MDSIPEIKPHKEPFMEHVKGRVIRFAEGPYNAHWLAFFAFIESSFFPIPPDILLIAILTTRENRRWFFYALITTIFSVFGALLGYFIGYSLFSLFGQALVDFYHLEHAFEEVAVRFDQNAFLAMFVSAFTPIPFKVFTIAGGLFKINLGIFIISSLLGRGLRFMLVAFIMRIFGKRIGEALYKHFNIASLIFGIILTLFVLSTVY